LSLRPFSPPPKPKLETMPEPEPMLALETLLEMQQVETPPLEVMMPLLEQAMMPLPEMMLLLVAMMLLPVVTTLPQVEMETKQTPPNLIQMMTTTSSKPEKPGKRPSEKEPVPSNVSSAIKVRPSNGRKHWRSTQSS
jgi:hypothetical protein